MSIGNGCDFPSPKATITSLGVEHVRLSYHYLDTGDIDGYVSLLAPDVQIKRPDMPLAHGRSEAERFCGAHLGPRGVHTLYRVFGEAGNIAAVGRFASARNGHLLGGEETDFVDIFTLAENGLILGQRRFLSPTYPHGRRFDETSPR
ncbi:MULTISPECIES: nuclear transport factor 2 family protein [Nocardiopsis]|uniref:Nuclear transport factor 2 family protein n=2 Tax=Nocardiopsis alba TaxID=53437 RepID=A0A7K2IRK1_9ACTN|nr:MULTISPECIES: nuclear transport factor 2 family protein [Nocardiopsis]MEC3895408.1 nuclear transport factor 2 family protein [Nocardiopsis sp. LDBS1602]MYR32622.1 hypothetical protein [Nocardiopsis alba]